MKYCMTTIFMACFFISIGQSQTLLEGEVRNKDKEPLAGAYIFILNKTEHTHADHSGYFALKNAAIGDTLQVSYLGFESKKIVVTAALSPLNIELAETKFLLSEIVVSPGLGALNLLAEVNLQVNPVNSSQEILRKVPGLIIGQHAGGGKAEQIFLRGFDIDHGTDISVSVDGMPVNMVSHAHGQGYADLHFLIPETVNNLSFGKGPYDAEQGNFATAGYVDFKTKESLEQSQIKLEVGQFNTQRLVAMLDVLSKKDKNAYLAAEYVLSDGAFESPQNFSRLNLMGKYSETLENQDKFTLTASHFKSRWDASGQIPQRLVDNGTISRFGAVDDTEGGNTSRSNFLATYDKVINKRAFIKNRAYFTHYDFELYSNFTFFLNDPINGDQIKQKENRQLFGWLSEYNQEINIGEADGYLKIGAGLRNDFSEGNELSNTLGRTTTLSYVQIGNIHETNLFTYAAAEFELGKWLINPSIRLDALKFNYENQLTANYELLSVTKAIVSPKINFLYNYSRDVQGYVKLGKGFHSNDTRVSVAQNGEKILPAAYGADAGLIWKPFANTFLNVGYWYLFLEQEFVYVGDEGVVEPSGETQRHGIDLSIRQQPLAWLHWNLDANYTIARALGELEGENYIPLAPDLTIVGGVTALHEKGYYGGVNVRFLKNRPANETNTIVAEGYTVVDANAGYRWRRVDFGITIQNLFNTEWNETQFATTSRLQYEAAPVEEIHFTPGTPFFLKGVLTFRF